MSWHFFSCPTSTYKDETSPFSLWWDCPHALCLAEAGSGRSLPCCLLIWDAFEHHHVAQLLRRFSSDYATSRNISLDATLAHHLQQCSYHLRLFRSWLISGQDDLECLYGFEGCSMVPTIYPLETLHNSLSLRQVNEFLTAVCRSCSESHAQSTAALFDSMIGSQIPGDPFMSQRILSSSSFPLRQRSDKPPWYSSGPSSTVSSAGPSSPTSLDSCTRFNFAEKFSISPPKNEEQLSSQSPEQEERQPDSGGLGGEVGMSGLPVMDPSAPETLTWSKDPETGVLPEPCKKELAKENSNPKEKRMVELEEDSAEEMLDPINIGKPKSGAESEMRPAGERVKPGEGDLGVMTGLDQSGLARNILVPCEEELLGEVLDSEHVGEEPYVGHSALSDQLLSGQLCWEQPLPLETSVEGLQTPCQEDQQN